MHEKQVHSFMLMPHEKINNINRFSHIDFLRALAILVVIIIHVLSDNLTSPLTRFLWNYLHFIIVAFIFCSGYVMYALFAPKLTTIASIFPWYKKRLFRLLIPLYWYLLAHYALIFFFPRFFSGLGLEFSWKYLLASITLVGGSNLNWLPLLFLQLAVLFPILVFAFQKKRVLFWWYIVFAVCTTVGFTIWQFPYSQYRYFMWIPWSLFLVLPWYFYTRETKRMTSIPYLFLSFMSGYAFFLLFLVWSHIGRSLTLIDNKYPPNLFYITYESCISFMLLALAPWKIFQKKWLVGIYTYISQHSYALFFIHYIVLDFVLSVQKMIGNFSVWSQVVLVVFLSLGVTSVFVFVQKRFISYRENR